MYRPVTVLLAAGVFLAGGPLGAQWPARPTAGMPRTADGKPNLTAAAPRGADGKPDFTGVWRLKNYGGVLMYATGDLKPEEMLPWAAAVYKKRSEQYRRDADGVKCLLPGPKAGILVGPYPMKVVQTPGLMAVLYEYGTVFRQFFMDGRGLPADPNPTWMGYSVAHWEEDTLVVSTAGYNDLTALDFAGHPHTEALRMTERYRRRDFGHLDLQVTFDDPKAYTRPWTLALEFDLVPDAELIEYVCDNERDSRHLVGESGEEVTVPVEVLSRYTGTYEGAGRVLQIVKLEGGRLVVDNGVVKMPLLAHGENEFTLEGTGVEFVKDAKGAVTAMVQHWNEADRRFVLRK